MCSRENKHQGSIFDPTLSVLTPLITANQTLVSSLESSILRLRDLIPVLHSAPRVSAVGEATCIEALAIAGTALASISRYTDFHAPLFDATGRIDILRQAGVVFAGDAGDDGKVVVTTEANIRQVISTMILVVEYHEDRIEALESWFEMGLEEIQLQRRLERERDRIRLAGSGERRVLEREHVERMLAKEDERMRTGVENEKYDVEDELD